MSSPAETLSPENTLEHAANQFHNGRPGYPVADANGILVGYCGRVELYDAIRDRPGPEAPLKNFIRRDPPSVTADQLLPEAIGVMLREQMEVLPVVTADGMRRVAGVLSPIDIFRHAVRLRKSA
jgi:CBS domain-containing protein